MGRRIALVNLLVIMSLISTSLSLAKKPDDVDVVTACKTDCPEAKNNAEAHECVERKAKIRPSFKKSKCWEINEEYEELVKNTAPSKGK